MRVTVSLTLTFSLILFGAISLSGEDFNPIQMTSNGYEDTLPQIEGSCVVWQGQGNFSEAISTGADWEIFTYNTETKESCQITDNDHDDISPQTDGTYVVWQGFEDGEWDVFLWDGEQYFPISNRDAEDSGSQISSGLIVWNSDPFGEGFVGPGEVMLYDVFTGTQKTLSQAPDVDPENVCDDSLLQIQGTQVIWIQTDEADNIRLFCYDHATGVITHPDGYVPREGEHRDGSLTVLSRQQGNDKEIFVYKTSLGIFEQITDNDLQDRYPRISGTNIVWMAGGEIFLAEYKCLFLVCPGSNCCLSQWPPPTFTWDGVGYSGFEVQFSRDPSFPSRNTLSSVPDGSSVSNTSYIPAGREWKGITGLCRRNGVVYWRVKGEDEKGTEAFSEAFSFTIEESSLPRRHVRRRS